MAAPIRLVLLDIGKRFGVNVVVENSVTGNVSATLHDATLSEALDAVTRPLGYAYTANGNLVVVGPMPAAGLALSTVTPSLDQAAVLAFTNIRADQVLGYFRKLYPHARISLDSTANALIVLDTPDDIQSMRSVAQGIDIQSPTNAQSEAVKLEVADPRSVASALKTLFSGAKIAPGPNRTVVVAAPPTELAQIKSVIAEMDQPQPSPTPIASADEAIKIAQARPQTVASAVAHEFPDVRAAVSGSSVILTGPSDDVERAKALVALIDAPAPDLQYTQVYRIRYVDAQSVADLISRSFPSVQVAVDKDLNALSVSATTAQQQRISDAIAQLDVASVGSVGPQIGGGPPQQIPGADQSAGVGPGGSTMQVLTLKASVPGANGSASTSAADIATAVTQFLQPVVSDLHITVPNNSNQLMVSGSPYTVRLAKQLIDQLDVAPPQVVLDTEILEVDENVARNLGLTFNTPALSTTYTEISPAAPPNGGTPPPLLGLQPVSRTPLSAQFTLNFLIENGTAKVLADPRITTISGHTASIHAGDTSYILTTSSGGVGVATSQQLQQFQTGVNLDITPVVNAGNSISVTLHPVVSSLAGIEFNLPEIATRDTETTVNLLDNQTLIIGGLIQETVSRSDTKTPILGDIPLVGRIFHNTNYTYDHNELIIVVTPHILVPGQAQVMPGPALPAIPTPNALPTLSPNMQLPTPVGVLPRIGAPGPSPTPAASPTPTPVGQVSDDVFTYGAAPQINLAEPNDPPTIYFASFSPTALRAGSLVQMSAVTSTNITRMTVGYGMQATQLAPISPGRWQASYNFVASSVPTGLTHINLTVTAFRSDGVSTSISIPVTFVP